MPAPAEAERAALTNAVVAFVALLRRDHRFALGVNEAHDALRALEIVGVTQLERVRCALRLTCCASPEQIVAFEEAFDDFFLDARQGVPNPSYAPRHTRPGAAPPQDEDAPAKRGKPESPDDDGGDAPSVAGEPVAVESADVIAWRALRARYSPEAARAEPPEIPSAGFDRMLVAAERLTSRLRLGRSRRWKPGQRGERFDLRRTLRASLRTGGEPLSLHRLHHPHRNPYVIILIDGSRSMAEHATPVLQFAAALCRRSRRARALIFSTELRDATFDLRGYRFGERLTKLGKAWGGGTRIGSSLLTFVRSDRARPICEDTLVIIFSDGLDAGDGAKLKLAMRELRRRAAAVVWLNPHALEAGYRPSAGGMRTALPYVSLFTSANDAAAFERLARTVPRVCA
jgi:uncharacterized protein with von Willebrand factor type A (vWA) domain